MSYKNKYLKYKLKYLKLKGGMEHLKEDYSKECMPETLADLIEYIKNSDKLQEEYNILEEDYKNIEKEVNCIEDEYSNIVEEYESHRENYMEKIRMNKYFENENLNIEEINKLIKKKEEESKIMEHLKMKEDMVLKTLKNTMEKKRKISEIMIEKEKELDKSISKVYKIYNQLDKRGHVEGQCRDLLEEF